MSARATINKCRASACYSKISNGVLQDPRLSFQSRGLMAYMLSLPDQWTVCISHLYSKEVGGGGRYSVEGSLKELRALGYISLEKVRSADGRIIEWRWTVYDDPSECPPHLGPAAIETDDVQNKVYPDVENQQHQNLKNPLLVDSTCGKSTTIKEIGDIKETNQRERAGRRDFQEPHQKGTLQKRAEALIRKNREAPLTTTERAAFHANRAAIEATTEDQWLALERYYAQPQAITFSRKTLISLIENWNGEIDRALSLQPAKSKRSEVYCVGDEVTP